MDQYLKRKTIHSKKQQQKPIHNDELVIGQLRQKLDQVFKQLEYSRLKLQDIRLVASQVQVKLYPKGNVSSTILAESSMQKSSIATQLFNGQAQKSINNIQQPFKLETTSTVADQRNPLLTNRLNAQTVNDQLSQSSKIVRRGRKIVKKV